MTNLRILIKQRRIEKALTLRQLALYSKVNDSLLSRYEAGKADITSAKLLRVMSVLGLCIAIEEPPALHLRNSSDSKVLYGTTINRVEKQKTVQVSATQNPHSA